MLGMADQPAQVLAVGIRVVADELFEGLVIAIEQAVTPALQGMEAFIVFAGGGVQLVDQRANRLDIGAAHQFADVLQVAFAGNMRMVLGGVEQCLVQGVAEWQLGQHVGRQGGQARAQLLQFVQFALDLGFALLAREVVIEKIGHGQGPVGNLPMITSPAALVRATAG